MWDREDHFGRWVQGICGVLLLGIAGVVVWFAMGRPDHATYGTRYTEEGLALGALYLGLRCLYYAVTGRGNVNRDNF